MGDLRLQIDLMALWMVGLYLLAMVFLWRRPRVSPHFRFPDLGGFHAVGSVREYFFNVPKSLNIIALFFFSLAFLDPHFSGKVSKPLKDQMGLPQEGIAIYLVADVSGSMKQRVLVPEGTPTKIELLKQVSQEFIEGDPSQGLEGRGNDMVGLVAFARVPNVVVPLTLDHDAIIEKLSALTTVPTKDQEGTAIGYAIYKTANVIAATRHFAKDLIAEGKPAYDMKSAVIILVTDGFQDPNPQDAGNNTRTIPVLAAAEFAKNNDIRLYIVNVDPNILLDENKYDREELEKGAILTGGKFFAVTEENPLGQVYRAIDTLEKSPLQTQADVVKPVWMRRYSLYPACIAVGMLCLFMAVLLESTTLRRIP